MDVEVTDGVSVVRIDRPPVNALDLDLVEDAVATLGSLEGPVVLTGAGKCFSAGVDLRALVDGGRDYTERFLDAMPAAFLAVFDYPAPVVAAINGHAIAGGCVVAMAADVRLMSGGSIGLTEVAVGVPFPASALEICRYAMGTSVSGATLGRRPSTPRPHCSAVGSTRWCRPMTCCPRRSRPPVRSANTRRSPMRRRRTNYTGPPARRSTPPRRSTRVCARAGCPTRHSPASRRTSPSSSEFGVFGGGERTEHAKSYARQLISMLSASRAGKLTLT